MRELPDDQRTALILSELGDLSHADVAEVIDCEVAKVKSLVFQARSGLIERRQARETPCAEIREQLATLRGGSLRRGPLRRHLKACPGCAEFREEVRRQRQMVAAVLPVVPTLALKENALAAVGIGASSAGTGALLGGGGGGTLFAAKAGVAKVAVIAAATTGAVGGAVVVEQKVVGDGDRAAAPGDTRGAAAAEGPATTTTTGGADTLAERVEMSIAKAGLGPAQKDAKGSERAAAGTPEKLALPFGKDRTRAEGRKQGFNPVQGESNGERAREFAAGRGQGNHNGLNKPHPGNGKVGREKTARGGSTGDGRPAKPERVQKPDKPAKERPASSDQGRNQAQPAPEPESGLKTLLPPGLTGSTPKKDPSPKSGQPREKPAGEGPDPAAGAASVLAPE
jgi:hypothetical protein